MRRLRGRLAFLPLVVVATLLASAAPAAAIETDRSVRWDAAPCATGEMSPRADGGIVQLTGWIQPCEQTPDGIPTAFAVTYYGHAFAVPGRFVWYAGHDVPTTFQRQLNFAKMPELAYAYPAVCLTYSPTGRVACVLLTPDQESGRISVDPIPTDDPRVLVPVRVELSIQNTPIGSPYCGTCL